jgi:DNA repair exonuclease SbcCD ATPase subunit
MTLDNVLDKQKLRFDNLNKFYIKCNNPEIIEIHNSIIKQFDEKSAIFNINSISSKIADYEIKIKNCNTKYIYISDNNNSVDNNEQLTENKFDESENDNNEQLTKNAVLSNKMKELELANLLLIDDNEQLTDANKELRTKIDKCEKSIKTNNDTCSTTTQNLANKIEELNKQASDILLKHNDEMKLLEEKIKELEFEKGANSTNHRAANDLLNTEIDELNAEITSLNAIRNTLTSSDADLNKKLDELNKKLDELNKNLDDCNSKILSNEDTYKNSQNDLNKKITELTEQVARDKTKCDNEIADLQNKNNNLELEKNKALEDCLTKNAVLSNKMKELTVRNSKLDDDNSKLADDNSKLSLKINRLTSEKNLAEKKFTKSIDEYNGKANDFKQKIAAEKSKIANCEKMIADASTKSTTEIDVLKKEISDSKNKCKTLQTENDALKIEHDKYNNTITIHIDTINKQLKEALITNTITRTKKPGIKNYDDIKQIGVLWKVFYNEFNGKKGSYNTKNHLNLNLVDLEHWNGKITNIYIPNDISSNSIDNVIYLSYNTKNLIALIKPILTTVDNLTTQQRNEYATDNDNTPIQSGTIVNLLSKVNDLSNAMNKNSMGKPKHLNPIKARQGPFTTNGGVSKLFAGGTIMLSQYKMYNVYIFTILILLILYLLYLIYIHKQSLCNESSPVCINTINPMNRIKPKHLIKLLNN